MRAALVLFLVGLCGCERGCARNAIERARQGGAAPVSSQVFPLNAVDCPDGLARCRDGVIETSRLFSYPTPCTGPAEKCTCPWDRLSPCEHGCVAEEIELALPRNRALSQLCAPSHSQTVARPPLPNVAAPPGACTGEPYRCIGGVVVACEADGAATAAVVIAACAHGCADEGGALDDDRITRDQAAPLLCRR